MKRKLISIDIETAPMTVHSWSLWNSFTKLDHIVKDWFIMAFAGVDDKGEIFYADIKESGTEKSVLRVAWSVLDSYEIIVGHNIDKFDLKKLNARFLFHGFEPPSPYLTIDTLKVLKKNFALTSNKLEYAVKHLGLEEKMTNRQFNGHSLWTSCLLEGNEEAWKEMKEYNIQDAKITLDLYNKLKAWIPNHPNLTLIEGDENNDEESIRCPRCNSGSLVRRGYRFTKTGKYQRYRCAECGGWCRSRFSEKKGKGLLTT